MANRFRRSGRLGGGRRRGRPLRPVEWLAAFLNAETAVAPGTGVATIIATAAELDAEYNDPTIMRTRGELEIWPVTRSGALSHAFGAFGIIVVDTEINGTDAPTIDPLTDADYDWLYHRFWSITGVDSVVGGETGGSLGYGAFFREEIDSQAMRRVETGESIYAYFVNDVNSDFTVEHWEGVRMLMKG